MRSRPSALLLDDGDLGRVAELLEQLGVEFEHRRGRRVPEGVRAPRDLLVTSGRHALSLPRLEGQEPGPDASEPSWVCLHAQDFLPLRERLRELGVHFLVHASLDQESLRLLLLQLLYRGRERRRHQRLPVGWEVQYGLPGRDRLQKGKLLDLSRKGCVIRSLGGLRIGERVRLVLPRALGGEEVEIQARVLGNRESRLAGGIRTFATALAFEEVAPEEARQLDAILSGRDLGTQVTPLAVRKSAAPPEPAPPAASRQRPPPAPRPAERRRSERFEYPSRVSALDAVDREGPATAMGSDLSAAGVRIWDQLGLEPGERVTLALHGGSRVEPLVVPARAVRRDADGGLALAFEAIAPELARQIADLARGRRPIESLRDGEAMLVSRVARLRPR